MLTALLHRVQESMDQAIGQALKRTAVAAPFFAAGAFGAASLYIRLARDYGAEIASLIMALAFLFIGLFCAAVTRQPSTSESPASASDQPGAQQQPEAAAPEDTGPAWSKSDKELLHASITSIAPLAVPSLMRVILQNLPLMAVILSAIFVLTRDPAGSEPSETDRQP